MDTVRIQTLEARYHLPPSAAGERARLDRLLPDAVGEALELALERQGIRPEEEVCLREVRVPVRLGPRAGDGAVVVAWSLALAEAIAGAVRAGGPGVVRYRSRREALVDCAVRAARGDTRRGWAFRQLGFGASGDDAPPEEAVRAVAGALAAEEGGAAVVPVLAALAASGDLGALARWLDPGRWGELAEAALGAAGWSAGVIEEIAEEKSRVGRETGADGPRRGRAGEASGGSGTAGSGAGEGGGALRRRLAAALGGSRLAAVLAGLPAGRDAATVRALAALALLDADPGPAGGAAALACRIGVAAELLTGGRRDEAPEAGRAARAAAAAAGLEGVDGRPERPSRPAGEPPPAMPPQETAAPPADAPHQVSGSGERPGDDQGRVPRDDEQPLAAARRTGTTAWGGLPFLVGLADDTGLPEAIAARPELAGRPFRWSLHRLALALVAADPNDPAALAFAGLPPGSEPPSAGAEPPAAEESAAIDHLAGLLAAALADRLSPRSTAEVPGPPLPPPADPPAGDPIAPPTRPAGPPTEAAPAGTGPDPAALVERVCRRRARVVADPGWIEIHLSLDDVSTALRRARLDLDPGWVPWLGVVLRFVYE